MTPVLRGFTQVVSGGNQ